MQMPDRILTSGGGGRFIFNLGHRVLSSSIAPFSDSDNQADTQAILESKHPMSKRQLIDDIRRINTTVEPRFLAQFDEEALKQYLQHLQSAQEKRIRIAGWVKRQPKLRLVS